MRSERIDHPGRHLTPWHSHARGQLYWLEQGVLLLELADRQLAMSAGNLGWLPPGCAHQALTCGAVRGLALWFSAEEAAALPAEPRLVAASTLACALIERIAATDGDAPAQHRRLAVLVDELQGAERHEYALPLPGSPRLLNLCRAILAAPGERISQPDWARRIGMSPRSLTRHFQQQTGLSFSRWYQRARLIQALARLEQGESVKEVAWALGYENVSAFIVAFRQQFGLTPGQFRERRLR